jgi:HEAT repeat protein
MRKRHGEAYEAYRRSAPFLLPVPRIVERILAWPLQLLFKRQQPDRGREVVAVVGLWTIFLMAVSVAFYGGGLEGTLTRLASAEARSRNIQAMVAELEGAEAYRERYRLALRLASLGEPGVEPLLELLSREEEDLRVVAAEALEVLRSPRSVPALCAALSDSVENVRYRSVLALNAIRAPESAAALSILLDDPEGHIRIEALKGLAAVGDTVVLERAPRFLSDEGHWTRAAGLQALGALGSERALPLVERCLGDGEESVRREAVIAMVRIGSPAARPALRRALDDEDFEVRIYAAEALKRLPAG